MTTEAVTVQPTSHVLSEDEEIRIGLTQSWIRNQNHKRWGLILK